ncbi:hypothetical protein LCGC14_0498550 [marine sediment metagenome]|uniref:Uncharacterized protein n=1 Tax=marine sediment metagenome TaxID=412755 RepID=A0A0F9URH8_9ZZZZ
MVTGGYVETGFGNTNLTVDSRWLTLFLADPDDISTLRLREAQEAELGRVEVGE